jgi:hypothetical protein
VNLNYNARIANHSAVLEKRKKDAADHSHAALSSGNSELLKKLMIN